jgi:hypothetical protein
MAKADRRAMAVGRMRLFAVKVSRKKSAQKIMISLLAIIAADGSPLSAEHIIIAGPGDTVFNFF